MNHFCKDCQHCNIPQLIKNKFDKEIREVFTDCPTNNNKIAYCFTKQYDVDWVKFLKYLITEGKLTSKELELLEEEGNNELRKRGK